MLMLEALRRALGHLFMFLVYALVFVASWTVAFLTPGPWPLWGRWVALGVFLAGIPIDVHHRRRERATT